MSLRLEILLFVLAMLISLTLFFAMRRGAVRGGFVALWLTISVAMVSLPFTTWFYKNMATFMGLNFAIDMLYIFAILFLLLYVFYLTVTLQRLTDRVEIILSRSAIVESYIDLGSEKSHEKL